MMNISHHTGAWYAEMFMSLGKYTQFPIKVLYWQVLKIPGVRSEWNKGKLREQTKIFS